VMASSTEPTPAQRLIRELKEKRPDAARAIVAELNRRIEARKRAEALARKREAEEQREAA
jgi:hypothetical protein